MKKLLLSIGCALIANFGFAQRTIDWSVEQIVAPTQLNSTAGGTSITYDVVLKNNGTGTVNIGDTVGYQLVLLQGTTVLVAVPNGAVYIRPVTKLMTPGDTMHLRGTINLTVRPNLSLNVTFKCYSIVINRMSGNAGIGTETSQTNNSKTLDMVWYCPQGWGVGVNTAQVGQFSVYPNPAKDMVTIQNQLVDVNAATEINIIDMTGKTVYTETNNNSSIEINTSNFNKGLYMIIVKNGVLSSTQTLSIQ